MKTLTLPNMPRPIYAEVQLSALEHNILRIKQLNSKTICMAVVKANAYGHGLSRIYPALEFADALTLIEIEGAVTLRRLGWIKPIVLLEGCFDQADIQVALRWRFDWVIHSQLQLDELQDVMVSLIAQDIANLYKPSIYLKLNTGMNRLGFSIEKAPAAISQLETLAKQFQLPAPILMTHFANADLPSNSSTNAVTPLEQFQLLNQLKPAHWRSSLGNSAACLNCTQWVGDVIRPGIAIYGATPGPNSAEQYGLKPVMSLNSEIIAVQQVKQGERVGYGSRWQAPVDSRIAVVACGYADGYPRHAPDGTPIQVLGQRTGLVGRVSMDMLCVDVSQIPQAQVGSHVQLWGNDLPVDEVAQACGTIGYELLCAVAPRVSFVIQ